ncbi:MAG: hypothetical protein IPL52_11295 [Flavobacteriales bacterium]|nr:hypothetical protein [Flavobacteriales bacterium]
MILQDGWLRHDQGIGDDPIDYPNNQFLTLGTCGLGGPTLFNTLVAATAPTGLYVNYHFYEHAASPEQRQECIDDQFGDPLSTTGEYFYDLLGHERPDPFVKTVQCAFGHLDFGPLDPQMIAQYTSDLTSKQAQLRSAVNIYRGTVDKMQTSLLVEMIGYMPWHPSHALRDTLLANYPLSDSVLITMLKRSEPMDAWHLTQVLIQNSPLSGWVWQSIDENADLPTYFYDLLRLYAGGGGEAGYGAGDRAAFAGKDLHAEPPRAGLGNGQHPDQPGSRLGGHHAGRLVGRRHAWALPPGADAERLEHRERNQADAGRQGNRGLAAMGWPAHRLGG